jgi:hypothetical protein
MTAIVRPMPRAALAILALVILAMPVLAQREVVPTPPGGGQGVAMLPADNLPGPADAPMLPPGLRRDDPRVPRVQEPSRDGVVGGDDVLIATVPGGFDLDIAAAPDGGLYAVAMVAESGSSQYRLVVYRSVDTGSTWSTWATFQHADPAHGCTSPSIHITQGPHARCFIGYVDRTWPHVEVRVAWSPLDASSGDFSEFSVLYSGDDIYCWGVDITSDAASFDDYYVYAAFVADDNDGGDIRFARSVDQGLSFEPSYVLGAISFQDRTYDNPSVSYGHGGYVHVVWDFFSRNGSFDDALRYRRASAYAGGGLGAWGNIATLTSHTNGMNESFAQVAASTSSPHVVISYKRTSVSPPALLPLGVRSSTDAGEAWASELLVEETVSAYPGRALYQSSTQRFLLSMSSISHAGYYWSSRDDLTDWHPSTWLADDNNGQSYPQACLADAHDQRLATVWFGWPDDDGRHFWFDAEWRGDPGYPVSRPGFPVDLASEPASDPGLADLDGNGDLEIIFGDDAGRIQIYRPDGTPLPGWPVDTGIELSSSPIAVGDLDGDGEPWVIAGGTAGQVLAYRPDGSVPPGWPVQATQVLPVSVVVGAVGGPYPRAVVFAAGNSLRFLDHHGEAYPGSTFRVFPGQTIAHPPAVGDVDGDGRSEVVLGVGQDVHAFPALSFDWVFHRYNLGADVSGPVSLGDLDLDGDVEVAVPLASGVLHVLDNDGTEFPGDWPVAVASSQLNGVAIAQCLGIWEPELAVTARSWLVSVLFRTGDVASGWPVNPGNWYVYGMPAVGTIDGSPDVIVGARGQKAWTWNNFGQVNPGWPHVVDHNIYQTPAYGDLEGDGRADVVFLSSGQLLAYDVTTSPADASRIWGMAGHDAERSGCADCALDLVPVIDDPAAVTRVSLAAPYPNPIAGQAVFSYAVPRRSQVELAVFDVRGRRVATVTRAEVPAGEHVIEWLGRDDAGRPVASGQYVAWLRVQGPGVDERVSRKVTVLR